MADKWIDDNKNSGPDGFNFTPQPDKFGYLNNPRWTSEQSAPVNYTGNESEEPQIFTPEDERTPDDGTIHDPCGHWHREEPYVPIRVVCTPITNRWDSIKAVHPFLYASCDYDNGIVVKCLLNHFYTDDTRYVESICSFKTKTKYPAETNICRLFIPDPDNNLGYLFTSVKYSSTRRVFKLKLDDLTYIADSTVNLSGYEFFRGFTWNGYPIATTTGGAAMKIDPSTLIATSSVGVSQIGASPDYFEYSAPIYYFGGDGGLSALDVSTMSLLVINLTSTANAAHDITAIGGGVMLDIASSSWPGSLYQTLDEVSPLTYKCKTGLYQLTLTLQLADMGWGFNYTFAVFSNRTMTCCAEPGICVSVNTIVGDCTNPWTGTYISMNCKDYDSHQVAGVYGGGGGWIDSVLFRLPTSLFYAHQICVI